MPAIVLTVELEKSKLDKSFSDIDTALADVAKDLAKVTSEFSKQLGRGVEGLAKKTNSQLEASNKEAINLSKTLGLGGESAKSLGEGLKSVLSTVKEVNAEQDKNTSGSLKAAKTILLMRTAYKFYLSDLGQAASMMVFNNDLVKQGTSAISASTGGLLKKAAAYGKVGLAAAAVLGSAVALYKITQATFELINKQSRIASFGVAQEDIQNLVNSYGGLISRAKAASLAMKFREAGIPKSLLSNAFELTNTFEKLTGKSTEAISQMIASGTASDDVLNRIGLTQEQLESAYEKAQGASQRSLTQQEKSVIALEMMSSAAKKLRQDVLQAFPDSPFKQASVAFSNLWLSIKETTANILKIFLPAIEAVAKVLTWVVKGIEYLTKTTANLGSSITDLSASSKKTKDSVKKLSDTLETTQKNTKKIGDKLNYANQEISRFRGLVQSAREASRTALLSAINDVSGLTGSTGKLLKESLSLLAVMDKYGVLYGKRVGFAINLSQEDLRVRMKSVKITGRQAMALQELSAKGEVYRAKLIEMALTTALLAKQEQSLLGISGEQSNVIRARFAIKLEEVKLEAELKKLRTQQILEETQAASLREKALSALSSKQRESFLAQASFLELSSKATALVAKKQKELGEARLRSLKIEETKKQLAYQLSQDQASLNLQQAKTEEATKLLVLRSQLNFDAGTAEKIELARRVEIAETLYREKQLRLDLAATEDRINSGAFKGQALVEEKNKLNLIKTRISSLEAEKAIQDEKHKKQMAQTTVAGSALLKLKVQAIDASIKIGEALAANVQSFASSIGNSISGVFEALAKGDKDIGKNFGKSLLSALGDIASAFASTFLAIGTGKIALGDIGGGAALIAASVALYAVAGGLKGLAAGGSGTTSKTTTPSRTELPNTRPQKEQKSEPTYILVSNRIFGSEEDQARKLRDYIKRNQRFVGKIV